MASCVISVTSMLYVHIRSTTPPSPWPTWRPAQWMSATTFTNSRPPSPNPTPQRPFGSSHMKQFMSLVATVTWAWKRSYASGCRKTLLGSKSLSGKQHPNLQDLRKLRLFGGGLIWFSIEAKCSYRSWQRLIRGNRAMQNQPWYSFSDCRYSTCRRPSEGITKGHKLSSIKFRCCPWCWFTNKKCRPPRCGGVCMSENFLITRSRFLLRADIFLASTSRNMTSVWFPQVGLIF